MDDFENKLSRMLEASAEELHPSVEGLVAEGGRAGVRKRRLRRGRQVVGATLAVAAVVAAASLVNTGHGTAQSAGPATTGTASVRPSASVTPSATPSATASVAPSATAEPDRDITWQAMLKILHDQLPPGAKLSRLDPYAMKRSTYPDMLPVVVDYDDGNGPSMLEVTIYPVGQSTPVPKVDCAAFPGEEGQDRGPRQPGYEKSSCQVTKYPDGGWLETAVPGTDSNGQYAEFVRLYRPADRLVIGVTASNAILETDAVPPAGGTYRLTRAKPPLGLEGWTALLKSPQWQLKVDKSVLDAGEAFAATVSRTACPENVKPAECKID
ncbi:hypothetical protein ABT095_21465 [Kitasatospora sp. NPDC002227]|uniref:hypothetical protein n=1 Tax=Kitasatospora sp. NPDC002227 TaxID=3154773 RepID=UPI00331ADAF8